MRTHEGRQGRSAGGTAARTKEGPEGGGVAPRERREILGLQRTIGNQGVQSLLRSAPGLAGIQREIPPQQPSPKRAKPHPQLAAAAEELGNDTLTMLSYTMFQTDSWNWYFSRNGGLEGACPRPASLASLAQYNSMGSSPRRVLVHLAGLDENNIGEKDTDALKAAYGKWPTGTYAVFGAAPKADSGFTCNIFVGEALHLAGMPLMRGSKYHGAHEIASGLSGKLVPVAPGDVQRGDIASMYHGSHVEIVTSVIKRLYFEDGFCSRGGGRGDGTMGLEKCDSLAVNDETRDFDNPGTKFFRVA